MIPEPLLALPFFSARHALRVGVSYQDLADATRDGSIHRLRRGWYAAELPVHNSDRFRCLTEIALIEYPNAYAAYLSALLILDLPVRGQCVRVVDLMGSEESTRTGDVQWHLPRRGIEVDRDTRCVTPALACAQAALRDPASGLMAADQALRNQWITTTQLDTALDALHGHRGIVRAREALGLADARHESPGESETRLVAHHLGIELTPQVKIAGASGTVWRVDFVVTGRRVILEYDGGEKYQTHQDLLDEKAREDDLRHAGWRVIRVTKELLANPHLLFALIMTRPTPPTVRELV